MPEAKPSQTTSMAASRPLSRPSAAKDRRVRKIERRLAARLSNIFPGIAVEPLIIELRPLIHAAARDGQEDHDTAWQRMRAAPLFKELVQRLTEGLACKP